MSMCRRFNGAPITRLIVSVPAATVAEVDNVLSLQRRHAARGCRAEFVRLAIAEKLARDSMISAAHMSDDQFEKQSTTIKDGVMICGRLRARARAGLPDMEAKHD